jgi:hypothetical protein
MPQVSLDGTIKPFEKQTGLDMAALLQNDSIPVKNGLMASMGAGLSGDAAKTLAAAIAKLDASVQDPAEAHYASAGGGGGGGSEAGDDGMAAAMAELMKSMQPKEEAAGGVSEVSDPKMNRSPAAIENDRSLSLFDRVTYRYKTVTKRMFSAPTTQQ